LELNVFALDLWASIQEIYTAQYCSILLNIKSVCHDDFRFVKTVTGQERRAE
jgi:hypothetical protein